MDGMSQEQMQQQMQALMQMAGSMGGLGGAPADQNVPGMPPVDPAMAQAYMQMFLAMQQGMGAGVMGMPNMPPLGGGAPMNPYAPPQLPAEPTVAVSVEGMKFQYQLTEDDLHKVFGRYGTVKQIRVDEAGSAGQITFMNFQDAQAAMNDLNGKVLNGLEGTLRITWTAGAAAAPVNPYAQVPFPWGCPPLGNPALTGGYGGAPPAPANAPRSFDGGLGGNSGRDKGDSPSHSKGVRKYTCRFLIGIENDQEFQVARRIIGAKGANMKRVVMNTEAKLRLRGEGSGYFEGAGQKESAEPLQLCISCTNAEGYKTAVRQVEELLKRVYDEYRQFLRDAGKPVLDLSINLSENQLVYSSGTAVLPDDDGSPKKDSKRGRRSRTKGGAKSSGGDLDRGEPGPNAPAVDDIEKYIDDRNEARRANNFAEADRIRELLHTQGVTLMDEPGGRGRGAEVTTWRYWRD